MTTLILKLLIIPSNTANHDVEFGMPRYYGMHQWLYELKENVQIKDFNNLHHIATASAIKCIEQNSNIDKVNNKTWHINQIIFGIALNLKKMVRIHYNS